MSKICKMNLTSKLFDVFKLLLSILKFEKENYSIFASLLIDQKLYEVIMIFDD